MTIQERRDNILSALLQRGIEARLEGANLVEIYGNLTRTTYLGPLAINAMENNLDLLPDNPLT